ncbi:pimeloyl-ACP methyl ester carboxylesterase [Crossiella equi]|uniref:Pimeloyl-ACP methyl ester carboxylesterase n=1 Tax=Crossiella equi TaxID=130796 RepID=A0ABS5A7E1_9PSEU|nr:alpha/beta hydrolase [Crossiella equi]MBP2472481.1 pimeloyl-ACP methyl ester carboxylesterase [Crossiella equi]
MVIDGVRVHGDSGPPVLLLPGGAEGCEGFFPGLVEGLVADPGCRVVVHDRPGTGQAPAAGGLAAASAHLAGLITRLDLGPVVVVGQSLGGAVATLLARDHPRLVAGLVLLDPTLINDARSCAQLERTMHWMGKLADRPLGRRVVEAMIKVPAAREARRLDLRPDCAAAHNRILDMDVKQLTEAVRGLGELSAGLREEDLPTLPSAVATADRKPGTAAGIAHARLAIALGAKLVRWPGSTHSLHLDHPDETLALVREVVAKASATASPRERDGE